MLGSSNRFFFQNSLILDERRKDVFELLRIKQYTGSQISIYLHAFDYFVENPKDFDGATLVPDLYDIPGLDLDAMLHDWHYLIFRAASSKATKRIADKIFQYGIKRKGKSGYSSWSRRVGLWIATPYLIRRSIKKYGEIRQSDKDTLLKHLQILCPSI